jgi:copper transport protein
VTRTRLLRLTPFTFVLAVALLVGATAGPASAHALLVSSTPADGSTVQQAPAEIVINFSERPDPNLSSIKVLDTSGQVRAGGRPQAAPGRPSSLQVAPGNLPQGSYTVTWRTVSKVDGHLAAGSFTFGVGTAPVHAGPAVAAKVRSPRPSNLAIGSRWVFFVGVLGLFGLAVVGLFVAPFSDTATPAGLAAGLWAAMAIGVVGITEAQRRPAHVALGHLLSTSLGHSLVQRGIPTLATGVAVLALAARPRWRRAALGAVGIGAAVVMLADAITGHAAAVRSWEWFRVGVQWLHFAAAGLWVGGLGVLVVVLRRIRSGDRLHAAQRYSVAAATGLGLVAVTGLLRALDEVGSWHGLWHTGFGQALVVKVLLFLALAGLGAYNRFRSIPAMRAGSLRLLRVGSAELVVAAAILIATALLQNLAPARVAAAAPAPQTTASHPVVVTGNDFGTSVRARLTVTPGTAGPNQFVLVLADYDTGQPVNGAGVTLRFGLPSRPEVAPSQLTLTRARPGTYQAEGGNLSVFGQWTVTAVVQRGTDSVEVPLTVTTSPPAWPLDVLHNPGLPDIYEVHLPGGRSVQVYLDPGKPGFNEFHATFFDVGGQTELPLSAYAAYAARATGRGLSGLPGLSELPGLSGQPLTSRRLDPGHFVSDVSTGKGVYEFTFVATARDPAVGQLPPVAVDIKVR